MNVQIGWNCFFRKGLRGPVCQGGTAVKQLGGLAPDTPEGLLLDSEPFSAAVHFFPVEGRS